MVALSEPDSMPKIDLSRLSHTEVEVLRLLADGHTAKSISSLTGRSVMSVNEYLRRARRKTGVPSSRELARIVKVRFDEKIDLASSDAASPRWMPAKLGAIIMGMSVVVAAAAVAIFTQEKPSASQSTATGGDPALIRILGPRELDPRHLAERIRIEARDADWAPRTEQALSARFSTLGSDVKVTKVTCGKTVCEVIGKIVTNPEKPMEKLQSATFNSVSSEIAHAGIAFGRDGFASYWTRP